MGVPTFMQILAGVVVTVLASIGCAYAIWWARWHGNFLACVPAVGCALLAVGIVGQRSFPSLEAIARYGQRAARSAPGPWDAGVSVPITGNHVTPVAAAGLLLILVGGALLLLFERVGPHRRPEEPGRPLELDDRV